MGRLGSAFSALLALSVIFGTQCAGEGLCGPYCSCERVEFPPMSGLFCTSAHGQSCCCDGQDPLCADNGTSVGPKCSSPEGKSICPENTGGCLAASRPLAASLGLTAQGFVKMPTLSIAGKQYNRSDLEQHFDVGTGSYIVGVKTESKAVRASAHARPRAFGLLLRCRPYQADRLMASTS